MLHRILHLFNFSSCFPHRTDWRMRRSSRGFVLYVSDSCECLWKNYTQICVSGHVIIQPTKFLLELSTEITRHQNFNDICISKWNIKTKLLFASIMNWLLYHNTNYNQVGISCSQIAICCSCYQNSPPYLYNK